MNVTPFELFSLGVVIFIAVSAISKFIEILPALLELSRKSNLQTKEEVDTLEKFLINQSEQYDFSFDYSIEKISKYPTIYKAALNSTLSSFPYVEYGGSELQARGEALSRLDNILFTQ